jgi:hypothetical protein
MDLPIQGRGRPVARWHPTFPNLGTLRIDCDKHPEVWYELHLDRGTLNAMLAKLDEAAAEPATVLDESTALHKNQPTPTCRTAAGE